VDPEECPWKPVVEEGSGDTYYWNINTGETTWVRPAELGGAVEESAVRAEGIDDTQTSAVADITIQTVDQPVERKANKRSNSGKEKEITEKVPLVGALASLGGYESESGSESEVDPSPAQGTNKASHAAVIAPSSDTPAQTHGNNASSSEAGDGEPGAQSSPRRHEGPDQASATNMDQSTAAEDGEDQSITESVSPRASASRGDSVEPAAAAGEAGDAPPATASDRNPQAAGTGAAGAGAGAADEDDADRDFDELVKLAGLDADADGEPLDDGDPAAAAGGGDPSGGGGGGDAVLPSHHALLVDVRSPPSRTLPAHPAAGSAPRTTPAHLIILAACTPPPRTAHPAA
jgi:hypothetical protein